MGLSLSVHNGSQTQIGEHVLKTVEITGPSSVKVEYRGYTYLVEEHRDTVLGDGVYLTIGRKHGTVPPTHTPAFIRLLIEAPRASQIYRLEATT